MGNRIEKELEIKLAAVAKNVAAEMFDPSQVTFYMDAIDGTAKLVHPDIKGDSQKSCVVTKTPDILSAEDKEEFLKMQIAIVDYWLILTTLNNY